jgi:hypothetical protein
LTGLPDALGLLTEKQALRATLPSSESLLDGALISVLDALGLAPNAANAGNVLRLP